MQDVLVSYSLSSLSLPHIRTFLQAEQGRARTTYIKDSSRSRSLCRSRSRQRRRSFRPR